MSDRFSKAERSRIMALIKGRNTNPELLLRKALHKLGYRYSLKYHFKELNCRPDLVLVSKRVCIFIDGCFWHACPRCYRAPKSHRKYWVLKMKRNRERDKQQDSYLTKNGWKIIRIWEHELYEDFKKTLHRVLKMIS